MKTITITPPDGYIVDKEKSTFEKIVFKPVKKELPKRWEDLDYFKGYYVNLISELVSYEGEPGDQNQNVFKTEEQAKAAIALAKLSQLMYVYNDGWTPDWNDAENKHVICFQLNSVSFVDFMAKQTFLAFKTPTIRNEFYENFKELILEAKPLL
jgi:hypothetical protein